MKIVPAKDGADRSGRRLPRTATLQLGERDGSLHNTNATSNNSLNMSVDLSRDACWTRARYGCWYRDIKAPHMCRHGIPPQQLGSRQMPKSKIHARTATVASASWSSASCNQQISRLKSDTVLMQTWRRYAHFAPRDSGHATTWPAC